MTPWAEVDVVELAVVDDTDRAQRAWRDAMWESFDGEPRLTPLRLGRSRSVLVRLDLGEQLAGLLAGACLPHSFSVSKLTATAYEARHTARVWLDDQPFGLVEMLLNWVGPIVNVPGRMVLGRGWYDASRQRADRYEPGQFDCQQAAAHALADIVCQGVVDRWPLPY